MEVEMTRKVMSFRKISSWRSISCSTPTPFVLYSRKFSSIVNNSANERSFALISSTGRASTGNKFCDSRHSSSLGWFPSLERKWNEIIYSAGDLQPSYVVRRWLSCRWPGSVDSKDQPARLPQPGLRKSRVQQSGSTSSWIYFVCDDRREKKSRFYSPRMFWVQETGRRDKDSVRGRKTFYAAIYSADIFPLNCEYFFCPPLLPNSWRHLVGFLVVYDKNWKCKRSQRLEQLISPAESTTVLRLHCWTNEKWGMQLQKKFFILT